jgi:probable F420-dependent oxidoreductase
MSGNPESVQFHHAVAFMSTGDALEVARAADELGFHGVYVPDHLFFPRDLSSAYTYTDDGRPMWQPETEWPDPWCLISAMAATSRRLVFTTGVYIAPARDLVTVAKLVATAAVIAEGRVRLGVGVGWCKEEFDATGQDFTTRGKRLDDMIPALRAIWSGGWVEYHGPHYDVAPAQFNPSPPGGRVPVYVGGHSDPAIRRAARLGDGWIAAGAYSVDEAWSHLDHLRAELDAAGRASDPFDVYLSVNARPDVDLYRRFEDAGVGHLICAPGMFGSTLDERRDRMARFADEIVAKFA